MSTSEPPDDQVAAHGGKPLEQAYAQLASTFNDEQSRAERRAARDKRAAHDETAYLLSSPANAERLRASLNGAERGEARARELLDPAAPEHVPDDERWFWTERWQAGEREVDEDIRAGRITHHDTVEDFIGHLDALDDPADDSRPPDS